MKICFSKIGSGPPLIIAHGLFGSSDNWQTLARKFAEIFSVYTIDLRNHGRSPHHQEMNFEVMAGDIFELCLDENLEKVFLIGHSLGGKTVLRFAQLHGSLVEKIVVADMGVKQYPPQHNHIIDALFAVDFSKVNSRKAVEAILEQRLAESAVKQFLLKNLYWAEQDKLAWRFNLKAISQAVDKLNAALPGQRIIARTLFLRGENSGYIRDTDWPGILAIAPNSMLQTIAGAGHWIHADAPSEFLKCTLGFFDVHH